MFDFCARGYVRPPSHVHVDFPFAKTEFNRWLRRILRGLFAWRRRACVDCVLVLNPPGAASNLPTSSTPSPQTRRTTSATGNMALNGPPAPPVPTRTSPFDIESGGETASPCTSSKGPALSLHTSSKSLLSRRGYSNPAHGPRPGGNFQVGIHQNENDICVQACILYRVVGQAGLGYRGTEESVPKIPCPFTMNAAPFLHLCAHAHACVD